jgi:hypothetical protein
MSLSFFKEAGHHGPIEPELAKLEINKHLSAYSGIYISAGVLHVDFSYSHAVGSANKRQSNVRVTENGTCATNTPISFKGEPPRFVPGLVRQLNLLEWSGLYKFLHTAYCDLANVPSDDRHLLLSGVSISKIKVQMPRHLAARAIKNNRLIVWLSAWLQSFQALAKDSQYGHFPCQLSIRGDDKDIAVISTTRDRSVTVSADLSPEVLSFSPIDNLPALKISIGNRKGLQAWCREERKDASEVGEIMRWCDDSDDRQAQVETQSVMSMTNASTVESESTEFTESGSVVA